LLVADQERSRTRIGLCGQSHSYLRLVTQLFKADI
jgi:hypothetical protein